MKIQANVQPRTDGSVIFRHGDQKIVFMPDASGVPCADVTDEGAIVALLRSGTFFEPADEADFDRAEQLLQPPAQTAAAAVDDEDDDVDFDTPPDSLPVEANTPPKRRPGRPRKAS